MKSQIFLFLLLLIIQINIKISKAAFATPSSTVFQDIKTRLHQKQPNERNIQTTVKYVGHDRTPVVVLDDLLSHDHYLSLRDSLRTRTDFYEGHGNKVNFPGKIAALDRLTVDPLIDAVLSSELLSRHFPPAMFDRKFISGFASILCNPWGKYERLFFFCGWYNCIGIILLILFWTNIFHLFFIHLQVFIKASTTILQIQNTKILKHLQQSFILDLTVQHQILTFKLVLLFFVKEYLD